MRCDHLLQSGRGLVSHFNMRIFLECTQQQRAFNNVLEGWIFFFFSLQALRPPLRTSSWMQDIFAQCSSPLGPFPRGVQFQWLRSSNISAGFGFDPTLEILMHCYWLYSDIKCKRSLFQGSANVFWHFTQKMFPLLNLSVLLQHDVKIMPVRSSGNISQKSGVQSNCVDLGNISVPPVLYKCFFCFLFFYHGWVGGSRAVLVQTCNIKCKVINKA